MPPNGWPLVSNSNWIDISDATMPLGVEDYVVVRQWGPNDNCFLPRRVNAKTLFGQGSTAGLKDVLKESVSVTPGLITVSGKTLTVAVVGSKTTDVVLPNGFAGGLTLGVILTDAAISTDGNMRLIFSTTIAVGITPGSITLNYTRLVF